MANVKSRLRAHKSAPKEKSASGKVRKHKVPRPARPSVSLPSKLTYLTPNLQIGVKNTDLLKDKTLKKKLIENKDKQPTSPPVLVKPRMFRPSKGLALIDDILKRELLIDDSINVRQVFQKNTINNNNVEITDQNAQECISPKNQRKSKKSQPIGDQSPVKTVNSIKRVTKFKIYQCDHCKKVFATKYNMRRHVFIHLDINKHTCKICLRNFRTQGILKSHLKRVHGVNKLSKSHLCHICNKYFTDQENLELHLGSHIKSITSYRCSFCNMTFPHAFLLSTHEKQHLVNGQFQCTVCRMGFDCRTKLAVHEKSHRDRKYNCQICGKAFMSLHSMRRHVQSCHSEFSIQCPICKKKLKGHLTEHLRTHDNERPHKCPDCGQGFTQSTQLNVHRRSHTGERPYPCRICNQPFSHSNALMLHVRRHTGEKPFACAMCPLSFSQLPHMKGHMLKIHGKQNPYMCKKCKEFFKLKVLLESHEKSCQVGKEALVKEADKDKTESGMSLSHMRFLLALLLTIVATKEKLKYLGFNKRLIDDILVESLEGMGHKPCKDSSLPPLKRLKKNIQILLDGTVPKEQMAKFRSEKKTTEELLELLTDGK